MGFVHKSINTLECELIRQYDSIKNGYNDQPGGGVKYHQTIKEAYTPPQMQHDIYDAIDAYRFQHLHGTSRKAYRHQQRQAQLQSQREAQRLRELESQLRREREERHRLKQEVQRLREQVAQLQGGQQHRPEDIQEQGCWTTFLIWCGLFGLTIILESC